MRGYSECVGGGGVEQRMVGRGRQTTVLFKHDKTGWAKDAGDGLHMDLLLLGRPRQDNGVASSCPTPRAHHGHGDKAFRRRWT